jgi:acetyl-CoA C-acetyltransferase
VAQKTSRPSSIEEFVHPLEAMASVAGQSVEDAGDRGLLRQIDAVCVINMMSWSLSNPAEAVGEAIEALPGLREYAAIGGNSPQAMVNRLADHLAAGRCRFALLTGCEVMHSLRMSARTGIELTGRREPLSVPVVGQQKAGTLDVEGSHGADLPVRLYPILETALRAKEGLSLEQHRERLGRFGVDFSRVASTNPHAWYPVERTADEIVTVSAKNRMLGYPYTRLLNSELYVDQSSALLMTTPSAARSLGIPESRWVYLHGGQDGHDEWFVSHREELASSPAIQGCVDAALDQCRGSLSDLSFFDFYSCFPVMVFLAQSMLGIADGDPRPRTLTGGLPFFGGPGNNFVTHAIVEAVQRCRQKPDELGMVTANGYYATKHSVGIYGKREPAGDWSRESPESFQASLDARSKPVEIEFAPSGLLTVEGYTVWHGRDGEPEFGVVCGRTDSGRRAWARTPHDVDLYRAMMTQEWVGRMGRFRDRQGSTNLVDFS